MLRARHCSEHFKHTTSLNSPNNPMKCVPFSFCLKNLFQNVSMDLSFVVCPSFLNFTDALLKKFFFFLLARSMEVLKTHEGA